MAAEHRPSQHLQLVSVIINQGWGVSAWQAAKELSFPHLAKKGEDNREDWGSSGAQRWLERGKTSQIYLQAAISLRLGLQLSKKQAGPQNAGEAANAFLPPPSSNLSRKPRIYQTLKQGQKCRSNCFPEMKGSYPRPKRVSELPEFMVVL